MAGVTGNKLYPSELVEAKEPLRRHLEEESNQLTLYDVGKEVSIGQSTVTVVMGIVAPDKSALFLYDDPEEPRKRISKQCEAIKAFMKTATGR